MQGITFHPNNFFTYVFANTEVQFVERSLDLAI